MNQRIVVRFAAVLALSILLASCTSTKNSGPACGCGMSMTPALDGLFYETAAGRVLLPAQLIVDAQAKGRAET
jgi:hypothetical protein